MFLNHSSPKPDKHMAKQSPQNQRPKTPREVELMHATAQDLHKEWKKSVTGTAPCGGKEPLADLRNFVKPNRPTVTWKKLGLTRVEVKELETAMLYHAIIQPAVRKKKKQHSSRRAS